MLQLETNDCMGKLQVCLTACCELPQLVALADSKLAGAVLQIPKTMYELEADWEIDPKALKMLGKIGACTLLLPDTSPGLHDMGRLTQVRVSLALCTKLSGMGRWWLPKS